MQHDSDRPAMSQKIFSMNFEVETVSLYLLCCALADAGATITPEALEGKWTGSRDALDRELKRLETRNIVTRDEATPPAHTVYRVVDDNKWR